MPTPFISTEPFRVLVLLFHALGAHFAGNATLGTTHAFNHGICAPAFPFSALRVLARKATQEMHQAFMLCSLFSRRKNALNRSHDCGWATIAVLLTAALLLIYDHALKN